MFGDVNKVALMGNVTNDPELRYTPGGSAVMNFSLATNRSYQKDNDWVDEATFHNIVVWRSAENLAKRIKKGTRVYIEGRIQVRSWENDQGQKQYKTEIVADDVILVARYEGANTDSSSTGPSEQMKDEKPKKKASNDDETIDPDDLPF